jgi:hypothetical protein
MIAPPRIDHFAFIEGTPARLIWCTVQRGIDRLAVPELE